MKPGPRWSPSNPVSGDPDAQRARREDLEWVEQAKRGDDDAFRRLVDRHRDRAYGLALRMLRSPAEAEDAAQEAFVRAWRALGSFRGESAFSTWLYRIVARQCFDRLEQLKRLRRHETTLDPASEPAAAGPDAASAHALTLKIERLMESLSPVQRAAVTLYYWQDRSVEDVAAALGLPENTVKTHLSRARAELREAWRRSEHDEPRG